MRVHLSLISVGCDRMCLGDVALQSWQISLSLQSLATAVKLGRAEALPKLIKAKGWAAQWQNFEQLGDQALEYFSLSSNQEEFGGFSALDTVGYDQTIQALSSRFNPNSLPATPTLDPPFSPPIKYGKKKENNKKRTSLFSSTFFESKEEKGGVVDGKVERIRVGFISSDFGVHPVSSLIRGMLESMNKSKIEVYCFALTTDESWWGTNISSSVEHFINLYEVPTLEAAKQIKNLNLHILIDLNGHTLNSGLRIMAHRPCALQGTFLGLPDTTGSDFVDFMISDEIVSPPEVLFKYFCLFNIGHQKQFIITCIDWTPFHREIDPTSPPLYRE